MQTEARKPAVESAGDGGGVNEEKHLKALDNVSKVFSVSGFVFLALAIVGMLFGDYSNRATFVSLAMFTISLALGSYVGTMQKEECDECEPS